MSDVFISYARPSADQAQRIGEALRRLGYGVWRDDELPVHRTFGDVIEQRLNAAKAVLVLWSAEAARSHWVRAEAEVAREAGKLVQLTLDGALPPLPFNLIQCADLRGWSGETTAPGWVKVTESLAELVGGQAPGAADAARLATAPGAAPGAAPEPLLAVLAFDNLSGDPAMAYFSDGVSEEIQDTLARGAELKVIGRTSAFQLRGPDKTVRRAATELKATHVLDGSVRRAGQRVRITAQLIACSSETTLWSNRFDRELTDIFALQDEIAADVAEALRITFTPAKPPQPIDPAAYDEYLKARGFLQRGLSDWAAMDAAVEHFRRAVAVAPRFAKAWAELAATIGGALDSRGLSAATHADGAEAANTALALDPSQGVAYGALSRLAPLGRHEERERLLQKALAASPTDPMALSYMAHFCSDVGRLREAEDFSRRALDLDPGFMIAANWHATTVGHRGRYAEARALWEANIARWPGADVIKMNALGAAAEAGDWTWFEALADTVGEAFLSRASVRDSLAYLRNLRSPDPSFAAERLERARQALAKTGAVRLGALIGLHRLGLPDEAFELADRSDYGFMFDTEPNPTRQGPGGLFIDSSAEVMRDARVMRLCAKLGLCAYWVASGRWPDCADETPYDFRAEARRLAAEGRAGTG